MQKRIKHRFDYQSCTMMDVILSIMYHSLIIFSIKYLLIHLRSSRHICAWLVNFFFKIVGIMKLIHCYIWSYILNSPTTTYELMFKTSWVNNSYQGRCLFCFNLYCNLTLLWLLVHLAIKWISTCIYNIDLNFLCFK